uniref:C-C motif chemokine 1 n=1 Tax=Catagonus wagneri TaxID=51154 RepID=A0A8C3X623_9CETA
LLIKVTQLICVELGSEPRVLPVPKLHVSSSNCCYTFVEKRISLKKIQCYRNTSSTCPYQKRMILKLIGGLQTCVLQTKPWVQAYLKRIKTCPGKEI